MVSMASLLKGCVIAGKLFIRLRNDALTRSGVGQQVKGADRENNLIGVAPFNGLEQCKLVQHMYWLLVGVPELRLALSAQVVSS